MTTSLDRIARELTDLRRQVRILSTQPRLPFSSIDGGFMTWNDDDGTPRSVIGVQDDGTVTTRDINAPPPVAPAPPTVDGSTPGLLNVTSFGLTSDGSQWLRDFVGIQVHVSTVSGFTPNLSTQVAQMQTDGGVVAIALPDGDWYVVLVGINTSGVTSAKSGEVMGIVLPAVTSGGIETYYTAVMPTGSLDVGSIWFDTGNGNVPHYWDGATWQSVQDASIATAQAAAIAAASAASTASTAAATAQSTATSAASAAAAAAGIAGGKADVLIQSSTPGTPYQVATTLWIDTTSSANTPKRWNGSTWVAVTDKAATDAAAAAVTAASAASAAQTTANTANTAAATAAAAAAAAQDSADSAADAADAANEVASAKTASFIQEATPVATSVGDTWRIPSQGNSLYIWDGAQWVYSPLGAGALASDVLAGKVVPINEAVSLAWGVPDPVSSLSGATATYLPDPWYAARTDGLQRIGLTPDGSNFAYVKMITSTKMQIVQVAAGTGVETALGSATTLGGSGITEQVVGIGKVGTSYYVGLTRINAAGHWLWMMRVFNSSGVQQSNLTLRDFGTGSVPDYAFITPPAFGGDGTNLMMAWWDDTTNKFGVQKYTTAGATTGSQINATTTVTGISYLGGIASNNFDFGATRFLIMTDGGAVYSMNTSGVLQSSEQFAAGIAPGQAGGLCWDAADSRIAFHRLGQLYRFTTVTTDSTRWAAYSWADRNATGGTHETKMSPTISLNVPKRQIVQLTNYPVAPGAASSGTDTPSTVRLYMSSSNGAVTTFHLQNDVTYPANKVTASGDLSSATTALSTSTFVTGASGSVQSLSGGFAVYGDGTGTWPVLEKRQVPAGAIMMWGGATGTPPTGYLTCDGSSLSTTTYAALFAAIGYTFGGSGASFNLPNFQNRKPLGAYSSKLLGTTGGAETHSITTAEMPSHTHAAGTLTFAFQWVATTPSTGSAARITDISNTTSGAGTAASGNITGSTASNGSGTAMSIQDPYLAINFIIRTGN